MHELSIANSLLEIALEHAAAHRAERVTTITLRIGALSCVHKDALMFSFEIVSKDTIVQGAELEFISVPVAIFCESCQEEVELPGIQRFRCPVCDSPSGDIRQGKELDVESIAIESQVVEV